MRDNVGAARTAIQNGSKNQLTTSSNHDDFPFDNAITERIIQYRCSFCWCELSEDSIRFDGIGACPKCYKLSHLLVKMLRRHRRKYLKGLGVER